jgi:uncharacterized membrane protein
MLHEHKTTEDPNMTIRSCLFYLSHFYLLLATRPALAATKRAGGDALDLPEPVKRPVKYFGDIHPVLAEHCVSCHGPEKQKAKLRLDSLEATLKGGADGAGFEKGASAKSTFVASVARLMSEDENMPPEGKGQAFSKDEVGLLRAWIDQGTK